jgi:hypothetical protein
MRLVAAPSARSIHFYDPDDLQGVPRIAVNDFYVGGAIDAFRASGGPAAVLLDREIPGLAATVEDWGSGWYVYRKPAAATGPQGVGGGELKRLSSRRR